MTAESPIVIALDRAINARDQKALNNLMAQWLVYDVKVHRNRSSAEIKLFHSVGAKPDLVKELNKFFPREAITGM